MKRLFLLAVLPASVLVAGCASFQPQGGQSSSGVSQVTEQSKFAATRDRAQASTAQIRIHDAQGSAVVEKVPFTAGVSSASVERLAKRNGCETRTGAGLVTDKGPVEVYKLQCEDGATFVARCELRQCRPMR